MKTGAEDKRKLAIAIVLAVIGILLFWWTFLSGHGATASAPPAAQANPPTGRAAARVRRVQTPNVSKLLEPSLDPTLKLNLLEASENIEYKGSGRNIFQKQQEQVAIEKPAGCPFKDPAKCGQQQASPVPVGPPPIPLKFYGFASRPGQPRKVFLSEGEDVFVAGEGDIVDRRYRVLQIGPASVVIEDVLSNNRQTIPLTAG